MSNKQAKDKKPYGRAVRRGRPELRNLSRALIALAMAQAKAEADAQAEHEKQKAEDQANAA